MGAAFALVALIGGGASVALVGWHGLLLGLVTASVGGSLATLLAALLGIMLRHSADEGLTATPPAQEPTVVVSSEASVAG
jgi:hypothetical protein